MSGRQVDIPSSLKLRKILFLLTHKLRQTVFPCTSWSCWLGLHRSLDKGSGKGIHWISAPLPVSSSPLSRLHMSAPSPHSQQREDCTLLASSAPPVSRFTTVRPLHCAICWQKLAKSKTDSSSTLAAWRKTATNGSASWLTKHMVFTHKGPNGSVMQLHCHQRVIVQQGWTWQTGFVFENVQPTCGIGCICSLQDNLTSSGTYPEVPC